MARKKNIRKTEYDLLPNCFNSKDQLAGRWREEFQQPEKLILELGCGKAELSMGLARTYPRYSYVGIDLKPDRMWYPAKTALEEKVPNIRFLYIHLLHLDQFFAEEEVDEMWITFPDPFPKKRQAKHRMINPAFLNLYQKILKLNGYIHFKTDNIELFQYTLELFVSQPDIELDLLSFNLHEDNRIPLDAKIKTTYEKAFLKLGEKINYLKFHFNKAKNS